MIKLLIAANAVSTSLPDAVLMMAAVQEVIDAWRVMTPEQRASGGATRRVMDALDGLVVIATATEQECPDVEERV